MIWLHSIRRLLVDLVNKSLKSVIVFVQFIHSVSVLTCRSTGQSGSCLSLIAVWLRTTFTVQQLMPYCDTPSSKIWWMRDKSASCWKITWTELGRRERKVRRTRVSSGPTQEVPPETFLYSLHSSWATQGVPPRTIICHLFHVDFIPVVPPVEPLCLKGFL